MLQGSIFHFCQFYPVKRTFAIRFRYLRSNSTFFTESLIVKIRSNFPDSAAFVKFPVSATARKLSIISHLIYLHFIIIF